MTERTKDDPITDRWIESPNVEMVTFWYDDGENVYPKTLVDVNGTLFTQEDAEELYRELFNKVVE